MIYIKILALQETNYVNEWLGMLQNHKVTSILISPNPNLMTIKSYHSYQENFVKKIYLPYKIGGRKVSSVGIKDHILYTLASFFLIPLTLEQDAIIFVTPSYFHTLIIPLMKLLRKKVYVVVIDPQEVLRKTAEKSLMRNIYYKITSCIEYMAIKKADKVFAVSTYLYNTYKKINKNTYYTPNGADVGYISKISPRKMFKQPTITFFGSLDHWRGVDILIEAFKKIEKKHDVSLAILGGGKEEEAIRDMCKGSKNIYVSGFINHKDAIAICKASRILVIPFRESPILYKTMPIKTFEYMACGVPIVVTNTGEHAKIIKELGTGILAEPDAESIARCIDILLSKKTLYTKIKNSCHESMERIDYRTERKAFLEEIEKSNNE